MHPSQHNTRPQHIRHHLHQPTTMHSQRPPPVGINANPQIRPPQHRMPNIAPHASGGHQQMSPYIPPPQRGEANRLGHQQPRVNSQVHHTHNPAKFRPGTGRSMGLSGPNTINQTNSHQSHSGGSLQPPPRVSAQQTHGIPQQPAHGLQSPQQQQQQQQQHGPPKQQQQQQCSHKSSDVGKQGNMQKSQTVGPSSHQGNSTHSTVGTHQKQQQQQQHIVSQQTVPPHQQSLLSQSQSMQSKHSSPVKPMGGIKHSQSALSFKGTSQPTIPKIIPIHLSYSQPSIQNNSLISNKSFPNVYKQSIQTHKTASVGPPQQTISNRSNNTQPSRPSPAQKLQQNKTTGSIGGNTVSILTSTSATTNPISILSSNKSSNSTVVNAQIPQTIPVVSAALSVSASISNTVPLSPSSTQPPVTIVQNKTINLHQQNKSISIQQQSKSSPGEINNIQQSSTTNVISMAQSQQQRNQKVLQNTSTSHESREAASGTLDNQHKTQASEQNTNPQVSTIEQDVSDLVCGNSRTLPINDNLANTKEKTPMCLVNELARYNKIQHQYRLTGETGPAHCKRFTVTLKLGDEDYSADGLSIKKAQHAAAAEAISKTSYQHPPMKTARLKNGKAGVGNITPTVELNALLMKIGEPAMYVPNPESSAATPQQMLSVANVAPQLQPTQPPPLQVPPSVQSQNGLTIPVHAQNYIQDFTNYNRQNSNNIYPSPRFQRTPGGRSFHRGFMKYGSRFAHPLNGTKEICKMTLIVGKHTFVGFGMTPQLAKHDAATKALEVLKPLSDTDGTTEIQNTSNVDDPNADLKSPISLVHETALKRNLTVSFDVKSERGPPHMKTFLTICKVGDIMTEGEGNGKKVSKKRAAEKMLEELKKLPPLSPSKVNPKIVTLKTMKRKPPFLKRKAKNLIKENPEPEVPEEVNPISKLIQIQQSLKEREPIYTLVEEKGAPRRREFVIEVSAGGHVARGTGANKKVAKKMAARNLLLMMGYEMPQNNVNNENNSTQNSNGVDCSITDKSKKVAFHDGNDYVSTTPTTTATSTTINQGGNVGRQIVPGILLMQQSSKNTYKQHQSQSQIVNSSGTTKDDINSTSKKTTSSSLPLSLNRDGVRPKDQLLYLAQLLGFQAEFSDYPKGNHGEYLTIVTLSTDPPQICHGAGCDTDQSQDKASMTALQMLSELGLDNVKPKKQQQQQQQQHQQDDKNIASNKIIEQNSNE